MILSRKLILTTALSILIIGGMGATFALTDPQAIRVTHNSTTCIVDDHFVACKVDKTTTVTETLTVTANQTGDSSNSTVTVTQTVTAASVAPFYDVYAGGAVHLCWTWDQYQAAVLQYGSASASPDSNCHGVPNSSSPLSGAPVPSDEIGKWGN